jgi:hypothetical protein
MIVALWAEEKCGKTTMALTFPKPLRHYDLDVGGYSRAAWRLDTAGVVSMPFATPVQMEKLMGTKKTGATIRFPKKLVGVKETWQKLVEDFVAACMDKTTVTIVIDSATQLWSLCHRARLQELQEIQIANGGSNFDENKLRERLQPMEYGEPNDRMRSLIYTARAAGKNLILTHYPRDVYAETMTPDGVKEYKTGELEPDGFKETVRLVDIVVRLATDKRTNLPVATITTCGLPGLGTVATGLPLPSPTYQGMQELAKSMGASI